MRYTLVPTALALALALHAAPASAQYGPCWPIIVPQAPNACGPGFYAVNECGCVYGPNYCLYPPFQPFQGMVFPPGAHNPKGKAKGAAPGHPPQAQAGRGPGGHPLPPGMGRPPGPPMHPPGALRGPGPGMMGFPPLPGQQPMGAMGNVAEVPPVPGMPPMPGAAPPGPPRFVTHPFARSPRDFFMVD